MIIKNEDILIQNGNTPELRRIRKDILTMISEGISSVNPYYAVQSYIKNNAMLLSSGNISLSDFSNIYLVSFGKASIGMAQAVVDLISIKKGVIITHIEDSSFSHENIQLYHGHHPIPNEGSVNGTKAIEQIVSEMNENDLLLVLISGGGSALLCHPRIPLKDMQDTTILLLRSGATIQDVNTIRKHLSFVKGGQLIKSVKGTVISLIISDVIGDPLSFIASGPTVGDETTFQDVNDIFSRYQLWDDLPRSTRQLIHKGINNEIADTPNTSDPIFKKVTNEIIANNSLVCKTVYATAKKLGYKPFIFSTAIQGEAKEVAKKIISRFLDYKKEEPCNLFITGGETTVTVNGQGKGGRNQEMVLALLELVKKHNLVFTSIGTDGIDGMSDAAGAIADPYSLEKARGKCIDPLIFLNNNDSNSFFKKMEDTIITGPTGTNVMDIQIVISLE
jgi:glycerate 2-kinase